MSAKRAPAVIEWYRCPISPALFKELHKRSDWRALMQTGGYLLILMVTASLALWSWHHAPWPLTAALVFLHGMGMSFLINGIHELGHGTVFKTKRWNKFFLPIFGFLAWHQYVFFDASHQRHHRYTLHPPDDMEVVLPVKMLWKDFWKQGFFNWNALRYQLTTHWRMARGKFVGTWEQECFPEEDLKLRAKAIRWSRVVLWGHAAIIIGSITSGWWMVAVVVSGGAYIGNWLFWLCNSTQHCGLADNVPDYRLCCRTIYLNLVLRFLYWQMNYHTEHHMYAAVPCYNLKRLHEAIVDDMPPCPDGLVAAWTHIMEVMRRQEADPTYQYRAPLPEANAARNLKAI